MRIYRPINLLTIRLISWTIYCPDHLNILFDLFLQLENENTRNETIRELTIVKVGPESPISGQKTTTKSYRKKKENYFTKKLIIFFLPFFGLNNFFTIILQKKNEKKN